MTNAIQILDNGAFGASVRGVDYHISMIADRWCVLSCRERSRSARYGSARWFDTLEQVSENISALRGIHLFAEA